VKALAPSPEDQSVEVGLSVALEGVNMAISILLSDPREKHRYAEVMRLATIGKALERQRARSAKRVADFVPPGAIANEAGNGNIFGDGVENLGGNGPRNWGCMPGPQGRGGDLADIENLADEPVDAMGGDDFDRARNGPGGFLDYGGGGIYGGIQGMGRHIGAPYGVRGAPADPNEALVGMMAGLAPVVQGMASSRAEEGKSGRRLDRAKEIDALSRAVERTEEPEAKKRLQALLARATASLEETIDPPTKEGAPADPGVSPEETPPAGPPRPRVDQDQSRFICTRPGCGNAHGDHWMRNGVPMDCDICNAPMLLVGANPLPAAAVGNHAAPQQ
jgi:hypothetical protein